MRGVSSSGYRVIEVWDSREAHEAWYQSDIAPNLPLGAGPITPGHVDLVLALPG